ncbi:MAG: ABC transporter permease [Balneolaceae bacterium]|nr:ABC transporter permease [Balneolaceae bacterium]
MLQIILYNLDIALDAIRQNKMRSFLTSLGIIFGVGSVIAMLAIGRGAEQQVLNQMQLLGTNNIIIESEVRQAEGQVADQASLQNQQSKFTPGLTMDDMNSIKEQIPEVTYVSPEIIYETYFIREGRLRTGKLIGVNDHYFKINNFQVEQGKIFNQINIEEAESVCLIGSDVRAKFFAGEEPVGKKIKVGNVWLTVIGVLAEREMSTENIENLGIRNYNLDVFVPVTTSLLRFRNRSTVTNQDIQQAAAQTNDDGEASTSTSQLNYHQIDKIIAQVEDNRYSGQIADIINRMLQRRHNTVVDYQVIVPEQLLQQERDTQQTFSIVLASIASISLIVGGIGIMNIMLASVVERYREIGVRMAVGAQKQDIKLQFLTEALAISITGGLIGTFLGLSFSYIIAILTEIQTIVTFGSIAISFGVAMAVGIIFGYFPAKRAAEQDPVYALRYE